MVHKALLIYPKYSLCMLNHWTPLLIWHISFKWWRKEWCHPYLQQSGFWPLPTSHPCRDSPEQNPAESTPPGWRSQPHPQRSVTPATSPMMHREVWDRLHWIATLDVWAVSQVLIHTRLLMTLSGSCPLAPLTLPHRTNYRNKILTRTTAEQGHPSDSRRRGRLDPESLVVPLSTNVWFCSNTALLMSEVAWQYLECFPVEMPSGSRNG